MVFDVCFVVFFREIAVQGEGGREGAVGIWVWGGAMGRGGLRESCQLVY